MNSKTLVFPLILSLFCNSAYGEFMDTGAVKPQTTNTQTLLDLSFSNPRPFELNIALPALNNLASIMKCTRGKSIVLSS